MICATPVGFYALSYVAYARGCPYVELLLYLLVLALAYNYKLHKPVCVVCFVLSYCYTKYTVEFCAW